MQNVISALLATFSYSVATKNLDWPSWTVAALIAVIGYANCMYIKKRKIWRQQVAIGTFSVALTTAIVFVLMTNITNIWIVAFAVSIVSAMLALSSNIGIPIVSRAPVDKKLDMYRKNIVACLNNIGIYYATVFVANSKFVAALLSSFCVIAAICPITGLLPKEGRSKKNTQIKFTAATIAFALGLALNLYGKAFPVILGISPVIELAIYRLFLSCYIKPKKKIAQPIIPDISMANHQQCNCESEPNLTTETETQQEPETEKVADVNDSKVITHKTSVVKVKKHKHKRKIPKIRKIKTRIQ